MQDYGYNKKYLHSVKTFLFDVDGVLAKSNIILTQDEYVRQVNTRDGFAIKHALMQGYRVGIITGGSSPSVKQRFERLGVKDIYVGVSNKLEVFEDYLAGYQITPKEILYMGDDIPDYEVMQRVGFPTCPSDAVWEIKNISKYISPFGGGAGCVRDVIEQVLKVQKKWNFQTNDLPPSA